MKRFVIAATIALWAGLVVAQSPHFGGYQPAPYAVQQPPQIAISPPTDITTAQRQRFLLALAAHNASGRGAEAPPFIIVRRGLFGHRVQVIPLPQSQDNQGRLLQLLHQMHNGNTAQWRYGYYRY